MSSYVLVESTSSYFEMPVYQIVETVLGFVDVAEQQALSKLLFSFHSISKRLLYMMFPVLSMPSKICFQVCTHDVSDKMHFCVILSYWKEKKSFLEK